MQFLLIGTSKITRWILCHDSLGDILIGLNIFHYAYRLLIREYILIYRYVFSLEIAVFFRKNGGL